MTSTPSETALDELTPDVFLCVGCGAQVSFEGDGGDSGSSTLLDRATCPYCEVVNDRALALLRKQQARERHEARLRDERRKQARVLAGAIALTLVALMGLAGVNTHAKLRDLHAQVERARAQVANVRERQEAVVTRFASAEASVGREAELSGAENRVRIERARYDEAAAVYNAAVGSAWGAACAAVTGLPERAPLSNEAHW